MFWNMFLVLIVCHSIVALGCQCADRIGSNFLNQAKRFDLIVIGVFKKPSSNTSPSLYVLKSLKGSTAGTRLKLTEGGLDCNHYLDFNPGDTILIGLNESPYKSDENSFVAFGCVTSALRIENGSRVCVFKPIIPPMLRKQRIGIMSRRMRIGALERKINRRMS